MVARVSPLPSDDPIVALNQVLSEVIDVVLDVRQAHRRVPGTHALHAVLDQLFGDLKAWARLLKEVRQIVAGHLDRLGQHVATALAEQDDDRARAALAEVQRGLLPHRRALSEL